jgi:AcrR family transcriptional regulator
MAVEEARRYHHGNLRSELLEAAEATLRARGAGELSLRELAREVGVSHAAPRRHFRDKQALLDALAVSGFERLGRELDRALARAGARFPDRLAAFARAYVRFATRNGALLDLMFAGKHRAGASDALKAAADDAFARPLALVAKAQAAGEVVGDSPDRVATVLFAALQGLVSMANSGMIETASMDDAVTDTINGLLSGLRPR